MQAEAGGQTTATIPWSKYTHVIHYALKPVFRNGSCGWDTAHISIHEGNIKDFVNHAHAAGVKAIIGLSEDDSLTAIKACTMPLRIAQFVALISEFVKDNEYDGVDIEWGNGILFTQYELQYQDLIKGLRKAMPTAALSVAVRAADSNFYITAVEEELDQINLMAYGMDFYSLKEAASNNTQHRPPYFLENETRDNAIDPALWYHLSRLKVASNKIGLGVPFYGRIEQGCLESTGTVGVTDPNQTSLNAASSRLITYRDLVNSPYWNSGTRVWDDPRQSQYIRYTGGSCLTDAFIPYGGPEQMQAAVAQIKALLLGGIMTYGLPYEYMAHRTGDERYPLSTAIYHALVDSSTEPVTVKPPHTTAPQVVTTSPTLSMSAAQAPVGPRSTVAGSAGETFTYYVDSANGSDSNPGTLAAPWNTIAKVNSTKLLPGQSVGFKRGGTWRETLQPRQSGTAGNPITFGAYGTGANPQILGSSSASTTRDWTQDTGTPNCWYTTALAAVSTFVWRDNVFMGSVTSEALLASAADTTKYYSNSVNKKLYVYATSNPTTGGHTFEIGQRDFAFYALGKSYLVIRGLTGKYTNNAIFNLDTGSSYGVIDGVVASFGRKGVRTSSTIGTQVSNSVVSYTSDEGISFMPATNGRIFGNDVSHAGMLVDDRSGISIFLASSGNAVYGNVVHDSGSAGPVGCRGIILDTVLKTGANDVYGNLAYKNSAAGILVYWSDNQRVYYNISHDNAHDISSPVGMGIGVKKSVGTVVYNNTTYHNQFAEIYAAVIEGVVTTGTVVENNLSFMAGTTRYGIAFDNAANMADHNLVYSAGGGYPNPYSWAGHNYMNKKDFYAATGQGQHDSNADPLLANSAAGDFTLLPGSLAIGAGIYIPGVSTSKPPNIGAK